MDVSAEMKMVLGHLPFTLDRGQARVEGAGQKRRSDEGQMTNDKLL
jgi:hypothetical protein